jgi:chitodextrinase
MSKTFVLAAQRASWRIAVAALLGSALVAIPSAPRATSVTSPSAPTNLSASNVTSTGATLCWSASTDNVGVISYDVHAGTSLVGTSTTTCATLSNLLPASTYAFSVKVRDEAGNVSASSNSVSVTTLASSDLTPPSVPGNLAWSSLNGTVTLTWTASTDDSGAAPVYDLFFGNFYLGSFYETSIAMMGFKVGTPYTFTVKARDASGNTSVASNTTTVLLTPSVDTTPPSAPTGVAASNVTASSVTLSWSASTDDTGVVLYQVYVNGTVSTNTFGTLRATVTGLTAATSCVFTVKALDAAGNVSSPSAAITVTTLGGGLDTTPPSAPAGLTSSAVTDTSVTLSWTASTDDVGVVGYDVLNGSIVAATATSTSATVTGLTASSTFSFAIRARDAAGNVSATSTALAVTTTPAADREQIYPTADPATCGTWALTDNVCCAQYCDNDPKSENCDKCGGAGSAHCVVVDSKACVSGKWPEVHSLSTSESWHYSRSTHYGVTYAGACAFGMYGICSTAYKNSPQCNGFCKAYPNLCNDAPGVSLRGNTVAPSGYYYSQFWPSLPGDRDNYLSCGECFEMVRTKKDGTDYQVGETGYTPPVVVTVADSCPCSANSKWCCGSGRDHCAEVSDFKYGCQLPPSPPPNPHADPTSADSLHLDLSDIAMARLQTGDANGNMVDGVIPTRYRRVPCPVLGNAYIWLRSGAGQWWFALSIVNTAGLGSVVKVEAQDTSGTWNAMQRDQNYTSSRPQERFGVWVVPQGTGPYTLPVSLRVTDPAGKVITAKEVITAWTPADQSLLDIYYIDLGVQF